MRKNRKFHPEADPLPENASVLEIEEYEKRKNTIDVNIYDDPARYGFIQSIVDIVAAILMVLWVSLRPIVYYGIVPGYDGLIFVLNTAGFAMRGIFAVAVAVYSLYILKLYRESRDADSSFTAKRKVTLVLSVISFTAQPFVLIFSIIQAISYYSNF